MNYLTAVQTEVTAYFQAVPIDGIVNTTMGSFAASFLVASVIATTIEGAFFAGCVAALASVIHTLTSPILARFMGATNLMWSQHFLRMTVISCTSSLIVGTILPYRIDYFASAFLVGAMLIYNWAQFKKESYPINESAVYFAV